MMERVSNIREWAKAVYARIRENRWLSIGIVVALALIVYLAVRASAAGRADSASGLQTAAIERGNLTATIGATGTVRANQSAQLNWETSGTVETVEAAVGDRVQAGDILAHLRTTSLPQNVILAQSDLLAAQEELEDFYDSYGAPGVAEAEQRLAEAQDAFEDAQRNYNYVSTQAPQVDIDQAFANMILARDKLDKAQDAYEPYANKPEDNLVRANLLSQLAQAQKEYDNTVRTYNLYSNPGNSTEIAIAAADLAVARTQLEKAQQDYEEILDGPSEQDIAAAEARVAAAQATLSQAFIEAPFDGVVTDAFPAAGDVVAAGTRAFQLDDLARLLVDVFVSEVDINRVEVGQTATLTFDAAPDQAYEGLVAAVALSGTSDQGAVSFRVTVELANADENVRPGMTAAVNVVVTELENVLLVPNRAVRVLDGQRVVYTMGTNGQLAPVPITLGATSETFSEILGDSLQEGDVVVLNPPVTTSLEPGNPPPAFMQGGGFQ